MTADAERGAKDIPLPVQQASAAAIHGSGAYDFPQSPALLPVREDRLPAPWRKGLSRKRFVIGDPLPHPTDRQPQNRLISPSQH